MNEILLLYLFTRASAISAMFAIGIGACAVVGFGCALANVGAFGDDEDRYFKLWWRFARWIVPICTAGFVLMPTSKDLALIVGGKVAIDVARSEPVSDTVSKALELLKAKIEAELKDTKK